LLLLEAADSSCPEPLRDVSFEKGFVVRSDLRERPGERARWGEGGDEDEVAEEDDEGGGERWCPESRERRV
jgi:hypothetical protein